MPRPLPFSLLYGSSETAAGSSENREDEIHEVKETISQAISEEEDFCIICLEEYTAENPHIVPKCGHNFHLNCILAWLERSDRCPVCDQIILRDDLLGMQT
ncbi:probable E3 ubiquitin-protein ligase RHB1A [Ananas comosus]|uniref:RING-type E3 ubiquitin transferase n=1 Tax=Ananas comosus TaxID=4615 RepID=A0A6P5FI78_ANACO|nr:probable E3 ubiquitin-protein ligase RHB1A [Ananas comosus]